MNRELEERIKQINRDIRGIQYVNEDSIPDIGLYMDQVIQFLDEHLSTSRRNDEDKIMTKTMINNYAKSGLIPSPEKKKYTKEHVMILILIYYYKSFMSISDIEKFLGPVIDNHYCKPDEDIQFTKVFHEIFSSLWDSRETLDGAVDQALEKAGQTFLEAEGEEQDNLQLISFISILSQDIISRLLLIQRLIDTMPEADTKASKEKSKSEKNTKEKQAKDKK